MKNVTCRTKRVIGATLVALTMVSGMSAVAFAGEPQREANYKLTPIKATAVVAKAATGDMDKDMSVIYSDSPAAVTTAAKLVDIKVDAKTGETLYSVDGGKTWTKLDVKECTEAIKLVPSTKSEVPMSKIDVKIK